MHDIIQMKIYAISDILGNKDVGVIILTDNINTMHMAIICDNLIKQELLLRYKNNNACSRLLPEVLIKMESHHFDPNYDIIINDIIDGVYQATLVDKDTSQNYTIRATDAILLHLITEKPIYVTRDLVKKQAVPMAAGSPAMALPYNALSDKMLFEAMKSAVDLEKYEMASTIRDELKKRGKL